MNKCTKKEKGTRDTISRVRNRQEQERLIDRERKRNGIKQYICVKDCKERKIESHIDRKGREREGERQLEGQKQRERK